VSDNSSREETDLQLQLDRRKILEVMRKEASCIGSAPRNILLAGPWGSGKTTLLRQLKEELEKNGEGCSRVLWFSPWNTVADGDARLAFLRLLKDELSFINKERPWYRKTFNVKPKTPDTKSLEKLLNLVSDLLSSKRVELSISSLTGGILGGHETFVANGFVKLARALLEGRTNSGDDAVAALRSEVEKLLTAICEARNKKRLVLLVDDLDRAQPREAIAILDALYHLFLPHSEANRNWPLVSIWAVNTTVLEEYLYREYKGLPSFEPTAYLEKMFDLRISVPPLVYASEANELWKSDLENLRPPLPTNLNIDDLAKELSEKVNYTILGNLRLHARVRRDCIRLWNNASNSGGDSRHLQNYVRDARLIVLIDAFPQFREKIFPFNGMWPDFLNHLNTRVKAVPTRSASSSLYRHGESADLATLLHDLGVLYFEEPQMTYRLDIEKRDQVQSDLARLWQYGL